MPQFLDYLKTLDTTQGLPDEEIITMTTIFREKGCEYDYVILPSCTEGMMPFLVGSGNPVYDTQNPNAEPESSSTLDNERRLFYVAITRAKKAVYISTSAAPVQGRQGKSSAALPSRFLEELQLDPTRTAIKAMQTFGAGRQEDMGLLINACRTCAGQKSITENLVKAYLPRLQVSLPADVMRLLEQHAKSSFCVQIQLRRRRQGQPADLSNAQILGAEVVGVRLTGTEFVPHLVEHSPEPACHVVQWWRAGMCLALPVRVSR